MTKYFGYTLLAQHMYVGGSFAERAKVGHIKYSIKGGNLLLDNINRAHIGPPPMNNGLCWVYNRQEDAC